MVGDLVGNNVDLWDTMFQVEKNQINARIPCKLLYMGHLDWNIVLSFHHQWCLNPWYRKVYFAKSRGEMLWSIVRHQFFWPIKDMFLKVGITSTSLYFMEWGCMDSSHVEGFNNLGTKKSSSLVQSHAPTSSIEDEPIFTKSDEDKATPNNVSPNNVSHNSDDSFDGHNSASTADLHILGRNGHHDHPNVPSLGCCD